MGRIYPEQSTLAWCEHCQTTTVHDVSNEPATCNACAVRLVSSATPKKDDTTE